MLHLLYASLLNIYLLFVCKHVIEHADESPCDPRSPLMDNELHLWVEKQS